MREAFISSSISAGLIVLAQSYIWSPVDQMTPDYSSPRVSIDGAEHCLVRECGFTSAILVQ